MTHSDTHNRVMDALWTQMKKIEQVYSSGRIFRCRRQSARHDDGMFIMCAAAGALAGLGLPGRGDCFSCVINSSRHRWQA